jgi:hypothetical protein
VGLVMGRRAFSNAEPLVSGAIGISRILPEYAWPAKAAKIPAVIAVCLFFMVCVS